MITTLGKTAKRGATKRALVVTGKRVRANMDADQDGKEFIVMKVKEILCNDFTDISKSNMCPYIGEKHDRAIHNYIPPPIPHNYHNLN